MGTVSLRELLEARKGEDLDLWARTINPQFARVLRTIDFDRTWTRAEGAYLWDEAGNRFLDMLGGFGMYNVGRNNPRIRAALGASSGDQLKLILRNGMLMAAIGLVLGFGGALGLTRLIESLLYDVGARDSATMAAVAAVLAAVALFACSIPAYRATKIDPLVALRYESARKTRRCL